MLVSYDFNSLYPSDQMNLNSTCPKTDTADPFKKYMKESVLSSLKIGRWNELNRCAFLTVKYNKPENLVFQHLLVRVKNNNS